MEDLEKRIRTVNKEIEQRDKQLSEELMEVRNSKQAQQVVFELLESIPTGVEGMESQDSSGLDLETIVFKTGRPVFKIFKDRVVLSNDMDSSVWRSRLTAADEQLTAAIKAVGRIEIANHPYLDWVGTGWLVRENVIVTNRHVAQVFAKRRGDTFTFNQGLDNKVITAQIDFLEEADRRKDLQFRFERVLHIEPKDGPDIALLLVEQTGGSQLASPISLEPDVRAKNQDVVVIGYPAADSRIPDFQLMQDIFGNVYDKKRLAPGKLTKLNQKLLLHDCSTLGGCSGAAVLDLETGKALGLHFSGRFLVSNYAVPAPLVAARAERYSPKSRSLSAPPSKMAELSANGHENTSAPLLGTTTLTIPLQITFSLGSQGSLPVINVDPGRQTTDLGERRVSERGAEEMDSVEEGMAPVDSYVDRRGYDPNFLGKDCQVQLPVVKDPRRRHDILSYEMDGHQEQELRYQHFSVMMSRSRRMCLFSAVNIDGPTSAGRKRVNWRLDPRIPAELQIIDECYGAAPRFSRGHMTRREDPIWGSVEEANQGNADSMHVTNAVPQMQTFNAGIWLALENYALQNARADDMRISVMTGPVLRVDDPERYGVRVPLTFWKVIAFLHDQTGKLSATGYLMNQNDHLSEEELVFGQHNTSQVPIATIEEMTGLSFEGLEKADPLREQEEVPTQPLQELSQIRF